MPLGLNILHINLSDIASDQISSGVPFSTYQSSSITDTCYMCNGKEKTIHPQAGIEMGPVDLKSSTRPNELQRYPFSSFRRVLDFKSRGSWFNSHLGWIVYFYISSLSTHVRINLGNELQSKRLDRLRFYGTPCNIFKDYRILKNNYNHGFKNFKIYNICPKNPFIKFHKRDKK